MYSVVDPAARSAVGTTELGLRNAASLIELRRPIAHQLDCECAGQHVGACIAFASFHFNGKFVSTWCSGKFWRGD